MRSIANLTALGVLALLLAACGSDDDNPGGRPRAAKDAGPPSTTAETNEKKNTAESRTTEKTMSEAKISSSGYDLTPPDEATMTLLKGQLDELALSVTCEAGTERPGTGALLKNKRTGTYVCVICKLPLFKSDTKFESGTGWPSFFKPYDRQHIKDVLDRSHGMTRTENRCARCGAHLGHLFTDGPAPTGLRYCMNSAALEFYEEGEELPELPRKP